MSIVMFNGSAVLLNNEDPVQYTWYGIWPTQNINDFTWVSQLEEVSLWM